LRCTALTWQTWPGVDHPDTYRAQRGKRRSAGMPGGGGAGERRGDLLGAQPGAGPGRPGGQPSSACKFVLVGLSSHAGPDGTGAFPSVATLVRYTGLSELTMRSCLGRLEASGIISPCDPGIVAARIKRADRQPKGWDLDLGRIRGDLTGADIAVLGHQLPGLAARAGVGPGAGSGRV
jgi:hypothetical protein